MEKTAPDHKNIDFDVVIAGGGLAGLTSAIHLSKFNTRVLVIEKGNYPRHKVCGEYVSNEVLPYLDYLDVDPFRFGAKNITEFELSTPGREAVKCKLPLGGFGISRYRIDYVLAEKAKDNGVLMLHDSVDDIQFQNDQFVLQTKKGQTFHANIVIGAYGKRSGLDIQLNRNFIRKKSPYLAVKMHVRGNFPDDLVSLHNFNGGYCGASKVEDDSINLCYISDYKSFGKYKDIIKFQKEVLYKNEHLKVLFSRSQSQFPHPLTISQISFEPKKPVEQHILMCGDTAGLIHPLCGNGMSMAIRSAQIASKLILKYLRSEIKERSVLEKEYERAWKRAFQFRLRVGRMLAALFGREYWSSWAIHILRLFPGLLPIIISYTHGKPMKV